jgi:predicted DCC family thiol-disulfide oxidoreductase YuxK
MIVFDGACGLCAHTVRFFFARERHAEFYFVPVQSEAGRLLAGQVGIDPDDPETFAVVSPDGRVRTKSTGAFYALRQCGRGWRLLGSTTVLLPRLVTDWVYDFVARRRILWFGTADTCDLGPSPLRQRLIQSGRELEAVTGGPGAVLSPS